MSTKTYLVRLALLILLFAGLAVSAQAQKKTFGLGLIIGEPTGVSFKSWMDDKSAVDGAVAWNFGEGGFLHLHADYLYHFNLIEIAGGELPFYVGLGARVGFKKDFTLGIRIPLGAEYLFESIPIGIFAEFVPILELIPSTEFKGNFGFGGRFYF